MSEMRVIFELCREFGVKSLSADERNAHVQHVEFFEKKSDTPLDPVSLAKALTDSMPPDSAMLFAATEDPNPTPQLPGNPDMS